VNGLPCMHATDDMSTHRMCAHFGVGTIDTSVICQKARGDASENAPCRVRYGGKATPKKRAEQLS
jgi:hypothetical protein